jgi:hypothetical protein
MSYMTLCVAIAAASWTPMMAQENLWGRIAGSDSQHVGANADEVMLTPSQRQSIAKLLKSRQAPWTCDTDDPSGEWLNHLRYGSVALSEARQVLLVEAGRGCARGGQGSNGAMWLIRFDGRDPVLLAGPQQEFGGFLYSVEPQASKGYRDVIVGWHMSGSETALSYFRFDGTAYRCIGSAALQYDEQGIRKIVPR